MKSSMFSPQSSRPLNNRRRAAHEKARHEGGLIKHPCLASQTVDSSRPQRVRFNELREIHPIAEREWSAQRVAVESIGRKLEAARRGAVELLQKHVARFAAARPDLIRAQ
jgi:hypothetical protein